MTVITLAKPTCKMAVTAFVFFLSAAASANAACSDPAGPAVDWFGCELIDADLHGANLTGAHLADANFMFASLRDAVMTDAEWSGSRNLEHATMCNTTMPDGGMIFRNCD